MSNVAVTMAVSVSGTRDGQDWPPKGGVLVTSAEEAASLVASGIAVEGAVRDEVETATSESRRKK